MQRHNYEENQVNLKVPNLVLVEEDNLRPKQCRVYKLFPGDDGIVRVVDVKTSSGVVQRAFSTLCVCVCISSVRQLDFIVIWKGKHPRQGRRQNWL